VAYRHRIYRSNGNDRDIQVSEISSKKGTNMQEAISRSEIEQLVRSIVQQSIQSAIEEFVRKNDQRAKELSLIERVIRVEEELKALREIEAARFEAMEKRFEALQREMNARFEAMEKRFEALQREINARFEAVDKRFESIEKRLSFTQWLIGIGFTAVMAMIGILRYLK
jgi:glutathione S-transferase